MRPATWCCCWWRAGTGCCAGVVRSAPAAATTRAPLPLTGQRIGAAAIALAVVVPLLVPGLTGNALSRFGRTGTGEGIGAGGALNEFASLRGQLTRTNSLELMRVRPNRDQPFYLRTKVLDRYQNGGGFTTSRDEGQEEPGRLLSLPPGQPRQQRGRAAVLHRRHADHYYRDDHLPMWYCPTAAGRPRRPVAVRPGQGDRGRGTTGPATSPTR